MLYGDLKHTLFVIFDQSERAFYLPHLIIGFGTWYNKYIVLMFILFCQVWEGKGVVKKARDMLGETDPVSVNYQHGHENSFLMHTCHCHC